MSFSGINISNNEACGLHSAFPTWYKISPIRVSDLMRYIFRPRHRYCLDYTYNSISRSHQSLKFVSACLAVDPTSRSEIQISFTGLKKFKSENGKKKSFLELNKYTSWDAGLILIKKCTYVKLWRKIVIKIYSLFWIRLSIVLTCLAIDPKQHVC